MLAKYFNLISQLYDRVDALLIIDKNGIVEYSVSYNPALKGLINDGYVGKHILEIYPSETEETSNHYRVMRSKNPILNEQETVVDVKGKSYTFNNSTFPIENEGETIGTIEFSELLSTYEDSKTRKKGSYSDSMYTISDIISASPKMKKVKDMIVKAAASNSSVLIYGDTGTGKELVAQAIHNLSARKNEPFISLNCSAIPENLLESILFGTVKGSFTGAENKKGLFELADKGTLFLDELNSMHSLVQAKILKALEEKKFRRVGGESLIHTDIRFIAAMNVAPDRALSENMIRQDLFYRLSVLQIGIPPLLERTEDIDLLTNYFIESLNHSMGQKITGLSQVAREVMNQYSWPGNVRELKNAVEHAFHMCEGDMINVSDLPENVIRGQRRTYGNPAGTSLPDQSLKEMVDDFEKDIIIKTLNESKNVTEAARKLKLTRQALQYKMERHQIEY